MSTAHAAPESTGAIVFEWIVRAAIVVNTIVLVWTFIDTGHDEIFEPIHTALLLFFVGELVVRLRQKQWSLRAFVTGPGGRWNAFDSIIVALSLLPLFVSGLDTTLLRTARLARITHSVRHVGHISGRFQFARFMPRMPRISRRKQSVTSV